MNGLSQATIQGSVGGEVGLMTNSMFCQIQLLVSVFYCPKLLCEGGAMWYVQKALGLFPASIPVVNPAVLKDHQELTCVTSFELASSCFVSS